jgi:transcription initiation factor TFIID TATA-box-binding protein
MENPIVTHPSNAQQAKAFTASNSLSFPGGAGDLTPPSEKEPQQPSQQNNGANGVTPATPAATPSGGPGVSGIVPTLQ